MFICVPSVLKSMPSSLSNHLSSCFAVFEVLFSELAETGYFMRVLQEEWPQIVFIWSLGISVTLPIASFLALAEGRKTF